MDDAHVAVLLEEIRGQFRVFGESLQTTNDKIDRLDQKVDVLGGRLISVEGRLINVEGRLSNVEGRLTNMALALNGGPARRKKTQK
jgi:hypothetical protein